MAPASTRDVCRPGVRVPTLPAECVGGTDRATSDDLADCSPLTDAAAPPPALPSAPPHCRVGR